MINSIFSMAVRSDFIREGKVKGVTWNLFNSFQVYIGSRQFTLVAPDKILQEGSSSGFQAP